MKKILIIDDDDTFRESLKESIEVNNYTVLEASDGEQGYQIIISTIIDLVISDILMPRQDGLSVIKKIKKSYPTLPIIAISGGGNIGDIDSLSIAKTLNVDAILKKPFKRKDIMFLVDQLLDII